MTSITQDIVVRAAADVNSMSAAQKDRLVDEIFVQQPNLLASVYVLPRFGVKDRQLEGCAAGDVSSS